MENPYAHVLDDVAAACSAIPRSTIARTVERTLVELLDTQAEERATGHCTLDLEWERGHHDLPAVTELCAAAHIARSTFYLHFSNVADVLHAVAYSLLDELMRLNAPLMRRDDATNEGFPTATISFMLEHEAEFRVLLIAHPCRPFIELWKSGIKYHCWQRMHDGMASTSTVRFLTANHDMLLEMVACEMVGGTRYALRNASHVYQNDLQVLFDIALSQLDATR